MVQYQPTLDRAFFALSDPTRRAILECLKRGSATISELAVPTGLTLTGVKKHVQVLEDAALVTTKKVGRERHCHIELQGIDQATEWLEAYRSGWEARFNRLDVLLEQLQEDSP